MDTNRLSVLLSGALPSLPRGPPFLFARAEEKEREEGKTRSLIGRRQVTGKIKGKEPAVWKGKGLTGHRSKDRKRERDDL